MISLLARSKHQQLLPQLLFAHHCQLSRLKTRNTRSPSALLLALYHLKARLIALSLSSNLPSSPLSALNSTQKTSSALSTSESQRLPITLISASSFLLKRRILISIALAASRRRTVLTSVCPLLHPLFSTTPAATSHTPRACLTAALTSRRQLIRNLPTTVKHSRPHRVLSLRMTRTMPMPMVQALHRQLALHRRHQPTDVAASSH